MLFSISQKKKKKSATQPRFLEKHTEDENVLLTSTGEVVFKVTLVLCLCVCLLTGHLPLKLKSVS